MTERERAGVVPFMCWGLKNPNGRIITVFPTEEDAQFGSFEFQTEAFQKAFWKKYPESWNVLKDRGWSVVKCSFTEAKP